MNKNSYDRPPTRKRLYLVTVGLVLVVIAILLVVAGTAARQRVFAPGPVLQRYLSLR